MLKIRMGVIGAAGISGSHIEGILKSNDAVLWALCDANEAVLELAAAKYHIPKSRCYKNYQDMLEDSDVDAISICTPNFNHYEIAREAIRHKKPFALEKPVTLHADEAKILREMIKETPIPHIICFSYRYKSAARYAKSLIAQGVLGRINHVYVQYFQDWAINEDVPLIWRFQKALSGSGALGDLGCHVLDLSRFLAGDIIKICAHAGTLINERKNLHNDDKGLVDVDDFCHCMAQLEGNISATFAISRFAYGRGNYQRIEVYGSKGSLVYSLDDEDKLEVCIPGEHNDSKGFAALTIPDEFKADQMQSLFDVILGKGDGLSATLEDGYINQLTLDAIIQSFTEAKWISIP
jgi:predicted dehydrogenase